LWHRCALHPSRARKLAEAQARSSSRSWLLPHGWPAQRRNCATLKPSDMRFWSDSSKRRCASRRCASWR
jgi:hypothetical protein